MRPDTRVMDVKSNLTGERVGMTIDEGALAHIMTVLTDLYSDPEMAVIREYSTNARDSHIEAGKADRPIEVTTPTPLSPFVRIRDFGLGLDADDIRDIYSRYGASTKRDSDDVVGVLGLGCKSALTYADQFTLSGIKDGLRTEVVVSRDEDGTGSMTLLAAYDTDEEDGVEVVVPARQYNRFEEKAAEFFRFWPEGTVLVNGKAPKRVDGLWIADDLLLTKDVSDGVTVVMGGVPYSAPDQFRYHNRHKLVAFVEIGEVSFVPSRESLQMNAKTKAKVEELLEREAAETQVALRKMVEEAKTGHEAARVAQEMQSMGLKGDVEWRGQPVPRSFDRDGGVTKVMAIAENPKRHGSKGFSEARGVPSGLPVVWLVGFEGAAFTPYKRQKLDQWLGKQGTRFEGMEIQSFVIVDRLPKASKKWIEAKRILKWAEVEAEKISKKSSGPRSDGRPSGSYDAWMADGYKRGVDANDIPVKNLFYYNGKSGWSAERTEAVSLILAETPDAVILPLPANRIEKFKRDFPTARRANEVARELAEAWLATVTEEDKAAYHQSSAGIIDDLDPARISDPALAAAVESAKRKPEIVNAASKYRTWVPRVPAPEGEIYEPHTHYPLLSDLYGHRRPHDHVYIYINATFAVAQLEGKES